MMALFLYFTVSRIMEWHCLWYVTVTVWHVSLMCYWRNPSVKISWS